MKHLWLETIGEGSPVEGTYYLRAKSTGTTKAGKPYLSLVFSDGSGEMEGRLWDNALDYEGRAAAGDFVFIRARGKIWQSQVQLDVSHLETVPRESVNADYFLPACPRDREAYARTVNELVDGLADESLRRLCRALLDDPELGPRLKAAPAATGVHQAYVGGLLEHVCSMMLLADKICAHYPALDRDLLLAGVLFHDLGKIREMAYEYAFDYTDAGKLVGHQVFGVQYLDRLAAELGDFPPERLMLLEHLILSHHGRPEYGATKIPMFAEALVLHYIDNLDAKVFGFLEAEAETGQGNWSERKWYLETAAYKVPRETPGYSFRVPGAKPAGKTERAKGGETNELPLFKK